MKVSFKKWLENYDQGLRRPQYMNPRFSPLIRDLAGPDAGMGENGKFDPKKRASGTVGEKQEDPMFCTLHNCKKGPKPDSSKAARLFGFMKKH